MAWLILPGPTFAASALTPLTPHEVVAKRDLTALEQREFAAMFSGNAAALSTVFLPGSSSAADAERTAWKRALYWHAWARARGITWVHLDIRVRTPRIRFDNADRVTFFAVVQEQYRYRYAGSAAHVDFGIGTRHYEIVMQRQDGRWYIAADDFTNPVTADKIALPTPAGFQVAVSPPAPPTPGAAGAVAYANRYCGSAPGCGGGWDGRYHPEYRNYNGDGGDCTSFISQVLHAGGFRETSDWNYDFGTAEGSRGWSNADGLAGFLSASGRGKPFAEGTYQQVARPTPQNPRGAVGELHIGDLIMYEDDGTLVHSAVVVGFDPHGAPLTDTHTNDRYHAPWEFGWKKGTVYWLWHIAYPVPGSPKKPRS